MFTIISKAKLNRLNEKIQQLENKNHQLGCSLNEQVEANRSLLRDYNIGKNDHLQLVFKFEKVEKERDAAIARNVGCCKRYESAEHLVKKNNDRVKEALGYLRMMRRGAKSPSVQKAIDILKEI